jgi:hypothetical protein
MGAACGSSPTANRPACTSQPTLTVGTPVQGSLQQGDARFAGAYVDYYALELDAPAQLTVRMTATEMSPVILIFGENGDVVAQAFLATDPGPGVEQAPSLVRVFPAACVLIGATSYADAPDASGAYTITVEP